MLVMTAQRTFVGHDDEGHLVQVRPPEALGRTLPRVASDMLDGFDVKPHGAGFTLSRDGFFLCAQPHTSELVADRRAPGLWETFSLVEEGRIGQFAEAYEFPETERFTRRIKALHAAGEPVKVYCGCGPVPREGFLNLDINLLAPHFAVAHPQDYFIFSFADSPWPIPDASVDYVFHEDFLEHVPQAVQWQFLAETRRVLKPGSWHRVNTPDIIASMRRNSDFSRGCAGVYTGEVPLDHISVLSHAQLAEMARTVGYREVIFTTRNHGVSPYAAPDFRPGPDRDEIAGNIYADLMA